MIFLQSFLTPTLSCPFCLNSSLFCIFLPFYFSFSNFLSLSFSFPFLNFSLTFPIFFSSPFHIPKWISCYSPHGGRGIFQNIDPWLPKVLVTKCLA
jgi:hypothetical protein